MVSTRLQKNEGNRRRGSSVGNISVGDTGALLSTMPLLSSSRKRSVSRLRELQDTLDLDLALARKIFMAFRELTFRNTWIIPGIIVLTLFGLYFGLPEGSAVHEFLKKGAVLLYPIAGTDQYGKGENDFYFVFFYLIVFMFIREFAMGIILRPFAIYMGITKEGKQKRFMEQMYVIMYNSVLGPLGLWIMSQLPLWFFETTPFYTTYPHKTHDFYFKLYYLGQAAFWVQQMIVLILQLEKPRKDFYELVLHHIITIALIWCLYRFHFTWMGLEVYITMDVSDFFLALLKSLNYVDLILTVPFFILFVLVWIYLRHYINLRILWSVLTEFRTVGEWELNWDTQQYKCYISKPIVFL